MSCLLDIIEKKNPNLSKLPVRNKTQSLQMLVKKKKGEYAKKGEGGRSRTKGKEQT